MIKMESQTDKKTQNGSYLEKTSSSSHLSEQQHTANGPNGSALQAKEPLGLSGDEQQQEYLTGWRLWLVYIATLLSMFLIPLDMTIVATAIPKITEDFQSLDQAGWYGSAFLLTLAVFQAPWGKVVKYSSLKIAYSASVILFELGSLICGVSRNSSMLIAGRAIAGCGGAGITIGTYVIISHLVPPKKAPAFIGGIGAAFSIASLVGPLLGGAFTGQVTWRWCFYVNLPIGGVAFALFLILFPSPKTPLPQATLTEKLLQLDPIGTCLAVGSIICYFLALQWGGVEKSWGSSEVIGCLVGFVVLAIAFAVVQWYLKDRASIAPRIINQRFVAGGAAFMFLVSCANFLIIYNLPLYFQSVKGSNPTLSGIQTLPLIVSASIFVVVAGIIFSKVPYYQIYLLIGAMLIAIGAGLLYTMKLDAGSAQYLGYQFIIGIGNGICQQIPLTVVQATTKPEDLAASMSTVLFFQLVSGALSIAAAQSVFLNRLIASAAINLPNVDPEFIIKTGATDLERVFKGDDLTAIRNSYLDGLHSAWVMAVVFAGLAVLVGLTLGFGKVEKPSQGPPAETDGSKEDAPSLESIGKDTAKVSTTTEISQKV